MNIHKLCLLFVAVAGGSTITAMGDTEIPSDPGVKILIPGPATCSTSGCHGGADEHRRQFVIWSQRDVHSRSYATLTGARAARMAEALQIASPTQSASCTACHAPLQTVAPELLAHDAHIEDGVSCASCHGASGSWIRSHTRPDWTHAERVTAGLRELRNFYDRANSCVACHQNIDPRLVQVGRHPALIFELDGQTGSEPRHWRENLPAAGAQAWFVGQAVALREMSAALLREPAGQDLDAPRWAGLLWVLQHSVSGEILPSLSGIAADPGNAAYADAVNVADAGARQAAGLAWTENITKDLLKKLAATHADFQDKSVARKIQAYRAERLVLALDRLLAALPAKERPAAASASLDALFHLAQSIPDFSSNDFAHELAVFERALD